MTWVPMSYLTSKRVWINVWEQWFRWWQAGWALRCIGMWGVIKLYGSNGLDGLYHVSMYVVSQFCEKYNVVVRCNICINVWSMSPTFLPCHDSLVLQKCLVHRWIYWYIMKQVCCIHISNHFFTSCIQFEHKILFLWVFGYFCLLPIRFWEVDARHLSEC